MNDSAARDDTAHAACLCAAWCRVCDGYAAVFDSVVDEVSAELAAGGVKLQAHWIDIEDEAELLGDLDVETFPTIVVAVAGTVRFAGPVSPQRETLLRLLRATLVEPAADAAWPAAEPAVQALVAGLGRRKPPG